MKHRILIEFEADHLPDDFTDQVAGRVYMMPCVKKTECTAMLVGDIAKDAERYQWLKDRYTFLISYAKARRGKGSFNPEWVIDFAHHYGIYFQDQRQWGRIFRQAAKDGYIRPSTKLFPRATSNGSKRPGWIAC